MVVISFVWLSFTAPLDPLGVTGFFLLISQFIVGLLVLFIIFAFWKWHGLEHIKWNYKHEDPSQKLSALDLRKFGRPVSIQMPWAPERAIPEIAPLLHNIGQTESVESVYSRVAQAGLAAALARSQSESERSCCRCRTWASAAVLPSSTAVDSVSKSMRRGLAQAGSKDR